VSTIALPKAVVAPTSEVVFTDPSGKVVTATEIGGSVVVDGTTLTPGGPAMTLPGGLVISEGPSGLVVGGSTLAFSSIAIGPPPRRRWMQPSSRSADTCLPRPTWEGASSSQAQPYLLAARQSRFQAL
jgi:hypothetical protein